MKRGEFQEAEISKYYHQKYLPLLVSSHLLRKLNLGQIDLSYFQKNNSLEWKLIVVEVKSQCVPSRKQRQRLRASTEYLSSVFNIMTILEVKFCKNVKDSLNF